MVELQLSELAEKMEGKILQGSPSLRFKRFNIDSRQSLRGELFFAIEAERDGHDFIPHAVEKGAAGAVISHSIKTSDKNTALIQVPQTLTALQLLAKKVHGQLKTKVVGITGSVGKTTVKEFTFSLLAEHYRVLKSERNFNNHLGLPLSLLRLSDQHDLAVLEYGMSAPGEISSLTKIAAPDVAVITNIKPVHLQFFPSIQEIALAKKEILDGMRPGGTAILNGDDALVREISEQWKGRKIFFGLSKDCTISAHNVKKLGWKGMRFELALNGKSHRTRLPFFNQAYLYNFLAAAAVACEWGVPVSEITTKAALLKPYNHRGMIFALKNNITLIDDAYNSSPDALKHALESLAELPGGRKIVILGDMLELGEREADFHKTAGKLVAGLNLDLLITVGTLSRYMAEAASNFGMDTSRILSFTDSQEAADRIWSLLRADDIVLVKGSRGTRMETIVERLNKER